MEKLFSSEYYSLYPWAKLLCFEDCFLKLCFAKISLDKKSVFLNGIIITL